MAIEIRRTWRDGFRQDLQDGRIGGVDFASAKRYNDTYNDWRRI